MHHRPQDRVARIHGHVPLAPARLLGAVVAAWLPFSVILADWRSRIPALGGTFRPVRSRTSSRGSSLGRSRVPSRRQARTSRETVCQGGSSCGSDRQAMPPRSTSRIASTSSRVGRARGRPPRRARGSSGSSRDHRASVGSEGWGRRGMADSERDHRWSRCAPSLPPSQTPP